MRFFSSIIPFALTAFLVTSIAWGQEKPSPRQATTAGRKGQQPKIGFVDKNRDGINDRFVDADGDGRNDVDGKPYRHQFRFVDKNKDGINDLWVDRDGDGVNDLGRKLKANQRQEARCNVLDADGDGRNDITGQRYDARKRRWMGERWGFWDESKNKLRGRFIDEDGDGIDDRMEGTGSRGMKGMPGMRGDHMRGDHMRDVFIDEDGDGICDGRADVIRRMGRMHRGGKRGGMRRP